MIIFFKDQIDKHNTHIYFRKLYSEIPHVDVPDIDVKSLSNGDVLGSRKDGSIPLELKHVSESINTYGQVYLTDEDKIEFESKYSNWFESKIEIAITFVFSIFGTLALILTIFDSIKYQKLGAIIGAYSEVPKTEAIPLETHD